MAKRRYTRPRQCERCGELDDGTCACTDLVLVAPLRPEPALRAERKAFLLSPALPTDTWPWGV